MNGLRNRLEKKVAKTLSDHFQYEPKHFPFQVTKHYLPDFVNEIDKQIVEAKGRFTAEDRQKHKAFRQQYPEWTVTITFQNPDAPITKGSKTTNAMWCEKHGILWSRA
jgi:hypothetical protein